MNPRLALANFGRAVRYLLIHGRLCRHVGRTCWWPCNSGKDETRLCVDCSWHEIRPAAVPFGPLDDDA